MANVMMARICGAALVGLLSLTSAGWATPSRVRIPTLFDSGVDNSGNPLPDGTLGDPHYTLSHVPYPSPSGTVVRRSPSPDVPVAWAGNDNLSAWIAPTSPDPKASTIGEYYYTTTFNLTGFDPNSVLIYGALAADDVVAAVFLNGKLITILTSLSYGPQNYTGLDTFDYYYRNAQGGVSVSKNAPLQDGFVPGINTLTFRVDNKGGSTGFRVEMNASGIRDGSAIPEPGSLLILAFGLVGALAVGRPGARAR